MLFMKRTLPLAVLAALGTGTAHADVRVNGFANLTAGLTGSDETLYGYDDNVDFNAQSLFAIQVSGDVNDKMTATGQIVARGESDYDANFEWAYMTYEVSDSVSVSAGRIRMPLFKYSASLDVGYSYHWVVAPQSVYDVPFNNVDGVRADYNGYAGDLEYSLQAIVGRVKSDFTLAGAPADLTIDNVVLVTGDFTYNNWNFRGVYATGQSTFDIPALAPALDPLTAIDPNLGNLLAATEDSGVFYGMSIAYDKYDWFVAGEYTGVEIEDSFYPDDINYYVTAGIRSGKWTPFVTYEKSDTNSGFKFLNQVGAFPEALQPTVTQLLVGLQQPAIGESTTLSLGVRYDLDTNIAIKADVVQSTDDIADTDTNLMRVAVNYIF